MSTSRSSDPSKNAISASSAAGSQETEVKEMLGGMSSDLRGIHISCPAIGVFIEGSLRYNRQLSTSDQIEFLKKLRIYINYLMLLTPGTLEALGGYFEGKTLSLRPTLCHHEIEEEFLNINDNKKTRVICHGVDP